MRYSLFMVCLLVLPLMAVAQQEYSTAPLIVTPGGDEAAAPASQPAPETPRTPFVPGALPPSFPESAITRIGQNTTGQYDDTPATPPSPVSPATPNAPAPQTPNSPTPPPSPISKLWPRDTVPIFLQSCTNYHPELIAPCTCVITKLMAQMPHDEFLQLDANGTIEQDPRVITIRQQCVGAPGHRE